MLKFSKSSERRRKMLIVHLRRSDQTGRMCRDWLDIEMADRQRYGIAVCLFHRQSRQHLDYNSLFTLALIFHHSEHYGRASLIAEYIFTKQPSRKTAWLVAIVADRRSLGRHGYQLYGTQFRYNPRDGTDQLFPVYKDDHHFRATISNLLE